MNSIVTQIIEDKGGAPAMARALRLKLGTVRMWRMRRRFPRPAWPEINATYPDLTMKRLREIEEIAIEQDAAERAGEEQGAAA